MKRFAVLLILLAFAGTALAAAPQRITFARYLEELEKIRGAYQAQQLEAARSEARALRGSIVDTGRGTFRTDDALLTDIADAKMLHPSVRTRVAATIDELRRAVPERAGRIDRELLQQLDEARRANDLKAGGEVTGTEIPEEIPLITRAVRAIGRFISWLGEKMAALVDWILSFFPGSAKKEDAAGSIRGVVIFISSLIVFVVIALAFQVLRRGRASIDAESTPLPLESRDADPLSRGSNEWERYAAQLAAAERWREAIRAWYHSVLVTLYSAGVLHFRKGRTNWEYVASIAPTHAWRGEFIELTRRFEQEWYGSRESNAGAFEDCAERARSIVDDVRRGARGAA